LTPDTARSWKDDEGRGGACRAPLARRADDQCGGQQIIIAAVGARADERLVEGDALAGYLGCRKGVAGAERLGDHRPHVGQIEHDVLAADPRLQPAGKRHAPRAGYGEVDVAGRPSEAEGRRADANADRAVRAVRAAVRVGAGNELPRDDEALLWKIKMENAV